MKHRPAFVLALLFAFDLSAQVYFRGEQFASSPRNWKPTGAAQLYGFAVTDITGGAGAAGGLFQPTTAFNRYADLYLGGTLRRSAPISASGRLALVGASSQPAYVATSYVGHFSDRFDKFVQVVGIALTGQSDTAVSMQAIVEFSDGTAYAGEAVSVRIAPKSEYADWSYSWNPGAGAYGYGQLTVEVGKKTSYVDLPPESAGKDFQLTAFGLFQPRFSSPDGNTFLQLYIGELSYTAFAGQEPVVRVNGPRTIRTQAAEVRLKGRAKVALGNRIKIVRYRILRGGKPRRYFNAEGTTDWTASAKVPKGASKIQVIARSDSGLTGSYTLRVRRK